MTREEAVKIFNTVLLFGKCDCPKEEIEECLRIAIKALEQEQCEDAISREDAIMCMTGEYVADMTYKPEDIISKHIQRLRALPPVAPQEPISQG